MIVLIILIAFIGIAALLTWYLVSHDHGEKEPIGALWMAAGFGLLGAIAAAFIEAKVLPSNALQAGSTMGSIFGSAMLVGVIEESCKFIPLAIILYGKRYFNEHTDGVIYFAIAGLGFGVPENMLYTLQFGSKVGISRILLTPVFHAATTAMVGFYLARGKLHHKSWTLVIVPLLGAMVLHGLYDFGLASGMFPFAIMSVLITLMVSAGLFLFYERATEYDQQMGLSVVGNNSFCRSCGQPNPKHNLYCARCGNRA